jgi:uncharacterized membrane protein
VNYIKMYAIALVFFLIIDLVWLGIIAKDLYQKEIGALLLDSPKWIPAIIFYMLFLVGLVYFVINPAIASEDFTKLLVSAAFFGFITYATYDLTNLATLDGWSIKVTIIDLIWGTFLSTAVSVLTYLTYFLIK